MATPYYDRNGITLYLGDCREILPQLTEKVDLVLTDPPYGLGKRLAGGTWGQHGDWDLQTSKVVPTLLNQPSIIWGGNHYSLPVNRGWLVWYKRDAPPSISDCELAWTNLDINTKLFNYPIAAVNAERNGHPTLKPLALILWCLTFTPDAQLILDPFLGSGTTAVAASKLGRRCIGIEINKAYLDIAVERLRQLPMDFGKTEVENNIGTIDSSPKLL